MPVYEEKLISPLAVRFTQEHIKTIFRDKHVVEETTAEIATEPGRGDYDLVLCAPFPAIEIIRWSPRSYVTDAIEEGPHWFTLDNRRLYCLQCAALKHWPKRVAAKVEILYADPGAVWKKYDSTTFGESVTVARSCRDAPLFRWDWQAAVRASSHGLRNSGTSDESEAWGIVDVDDKKETVDKLLDACEESSSPSSTLARLLEYELAQEQRLVAQKASTQRSATPSTEEPSDDSDGSPQSPHRHAQENKAPRAKPVEHTPRDSHQRRQLAQYHQWWHHQQHDQQHQQHQQHQEHQHQEWAKTLGKDALLLQALAEIAHSMNAPNFDGKLRIASWNERFGRRLGPLRRFLEARPQHYVVFGEADGKYTVRAAGQPCAMPRPVGPQPMSSTTTPGAQEHRRGRPHASAAASGYSNKGRTAQAPPQPYHAGPVWVPKGPQQC